MVRLCGLVVVVLLAVICCPLVAYALADPDTPPALNDIYVYTDLLEDGDIGVFMEYYLDYASTPNETAAEAFLAVFIDTDGATQLGSVAPYVYDTSGYGHGAMWIYFSAADASSYGLDAANWASYEVWFVGNPTANWTGDPPKTEVGLSWWQTSGDSAVLLALRVLSFADTLELEWGVNMIDSTALGNRLSSNGESYFINVIPDLQTMAPNCFSDATVTPVDEEIDYTTEFGATMTNSTGVVVGSPIVLSEGSNTVNVTTTGTFSVNLTQGTTGNVTNGTGVVTGSPVDLVAGITTITATAIGTLIIDVNLIDTQTGITDTITGTAFDLTAIATHFGMSRIMFSGFVWLAISVVICAAFYRLSWQTGYGGGGKVVLIAFNVCILVGAVLGMLPVLVAALMFIAFGGFTGYVMFFRTASV